jgi:predicted CxxxxCH...CXXCH cytochrome family protein
MRFTHSILLSTALAGLVATACESARSPQDGSGGGWVPTTGAHPLHVQGTPLAGPIPCSECHSSSFAVVFPGPISRSNGATPSYDFATRTCSNVYCHDGGPALPVGGGTQPSPVWDPPSSIACGSCHALPGGTVATPWHPAIAGGAECQLCHPGYTNTSVNTPLHVNGVRNLTVPDMLTNCAACHGDATRVVPPGVAPVLVAAPPVNRRGESSTALPNVGAHQSHLNPGPGSISAPIACTECHVVPTDLVHVGPTPNSPVTLAWGPLARAGGATPSYAPPPITTCTNYCHGQTMASLGGTLTQPVWIRVDGTQAACGTCHAIPPTSFSHQLHTGQEGFPCSVCHGDGYSSSSVVASTHVNGVVTFGPAIPGWNPTASSLGGWTGTSVGCHGGTHYWSPGRTPGCW